MNRSLVGTVVCLMLGGIVAAGCGAESEPSAEPALGSPSSLAIPAGPVAVPLSEPTPPNEFRGANRDFLRRVRTYLTMSPEIDAPSDRRMIAIGREFCSIMTGGGQIAAKVDFWGGNDSSWPEDSDTQIFLAAFDTWCPDQKAGYMRIRYYEEDERRPATIAEKADMVRFVAGFHEVPKVIDVEAMTDVQIVAASKVLCAQDFTPSWRERPDVREILDDLPNRTRLTFTLGVVYDFCRERADDFENWFKNSSET